MDFHNLFSQQTQKLKASKIRELMKYAAMPGVISFGGGMPDPVNFPRDSVSNIIEAWDEKKYSTAMQYGATGGYKALNDAVKERMAGKGILLDNQESIITTGGQQSLFILARLFIDKSDVIFTEEPSFIGAMAAFISQEPQIVGIPLEDDGVDLVKLEEELVKYTEQGKKVKFFYTIPNFQNPSGVTMSQEKRKKLYDLSLKYNLPVIEDDPYGDLYYDGVDSDYRPVKSYGNEAPVIYVSSVSKILCPGFRIGWTLADSTVIDKMGLIKQSIDACSSTFGQVVSADYLTGGMIDDYLSKMRGIYKEKRDAMLTAIKKHFPSGIKTSNPKGGFFVYIDLPVGVSGDALFQEAIKQNVAFVTGEPFHIDGEEGDKHLRLSFSGLSIEQIEKGISIIGSVIKQSF